MSANAREDEDEDEDEAIQRALARSMERYGRPQLGPAENPPKPRAEKSPTTRQSITTAAATDRPRRTAIRPRQAASAEVPPPEDIVVIRVPLPRFVAEELKIRSAFERLSQKQFIENVFREALDIPAVTTASNGGGPRVRARARGKTA